jgi:monovalent cation:H+ antiporter-2, CPA2 family
VGANLPVAAGEGGGGTAAVASMEPRAASTPLPDPAWPYPRRTPLDTEATVVLHPDPATAGGCGHLGSIVPVQPSSPGCEECVAMGEGWVHLRICMTCGHVGCCDSSKHRHATKHHQATGHPIARSMEPGESWGWCFVDRIVF